MSREGAAGGAGTVRGLPAFPPRIGRRVLLAIASIVAVPPVLGASSELVPMSTSARTAAAGNEAVLTPDSLASLAAPAATRLLHVPPDDVLYDDLEHFRALGGWQGSLGARPLSRMEAARALSTTIAACGAEVATAPADATGAARATRATGATGTMETAKPTETKGAHGGVRRKRSLDRLRSWNDAPGSTGPAAPARSFACLDLEAVMGIYAVASDLDSLADLDRRQRRESFVALSADAALGERLFASFRVHEDYTRQTPYRRAKGWADNTPSGFRKAFTNATARNDRAILGVGWRWGELTLGREDRRWGTGRHGTLFLSEHPFPLDGVSLRVRSRRFSMTSLFAQLRRGGRNMPGDSLVLPDPRANADAWLAAHRFEIRPWRSVGVGVYEAVAYGGRGVDLGYLNPIALLAAVTQDLDNRARVDDKKVLGFDLALDLPPATIYGEFLINRVVSLDSATRGDSTQISSYAQLAGLRWADPAGWNGADLDLEYAHLDPEVYFHHDRDPGRALLHEGELIGHWLGPNADDFLIRLTLPPHRALGELRLSYEQARWGRIDGQRGTELGFAGLVRKDKRWITGRKEIERICSAEWLRRGLVAPFGTRLDAGIVVARVERDGPRNDRGWQAECRLNWRRALRLRESAWE